MLAVYASVANLPLHVRSDTDHMFLVLLLLCFLFQEIGMRVHFEELTGVPLKESFLNNVEKKGDRLLNFMRTVCADKNKTFLRRVTNLQVLRGQKEGCSEDLKDMLLLLLSYFDEKEENLFHYVEETCLPKEVQVESLPVTPCIIVCGKTILSFMVKKQS